MLYPIFICMALLVSAARCDVTNTLSPLTLAESPDFTSVNNACAGSNSVSDCQQLSQHDATYSFDADEAVSVSDANHSLRSPEYLDDKLSRKDQLMFMSRDPGYWQASNQSTLRQVLMIHRHGDRTPINFAPNDPIANEAFWQFHGLGQLTNRGKDRLYVLGKIIRYRYDEFLKGSVNKNMRKSRASGSLRCIESAQVFLSSLLSLDHEESPDAKSLVWDQKANKLAQVWQPASVNTLAAKYDGMLNEAAECKALEAEYVALDNTDENKKLMEDYKKEREVLEKEIGFVMDHFYKWFWASSLLEVERSYFANKIGPAMLAIYDRLQQAGDRALVLFQSSFKLRRLRAGLLIDDMINNMEEIKSGSESPFTKKFVHYSAHDINLVFLLGILNTIENFPHRPDYASNIIIELHHDQGRGEWFVKIFYMPHVPSKPTELHIDACEQLNDRKRCTLSNFATFVDKYRVSSWMDWMRECGNSLEEMNPYRQNS